jgi:uncharacterized protein (TIGR03435 family)
MKTPRFFTTPAISLILAALSVAPQNVWGNGVRIGEPASPLRLAEILQAPEGTDATWEQLRGKVVVLDFWATWCGPCVASLPHWNELALQFRDKPVVFIAISDENKDVVTSFLKRRTISSWVGLEGITQSTRDRYGVRGIPTTIIVNQQGVVVARTHPVHLEAKRIQEVLDTQRSSLPPPLPEESADNTGNTVAVAKQPPLFEVSIRRSGARPPGHGYNCWSWNSEHSDVHGEYASVESAICQLFQVRKSLLDVRATLPEIDYDFSLHMNIGGQREAEELFATALRQSFNVTVKRESRDRAVLLLGAASTNAPGLQIYDPTLPPSGGVDGEGELSYGATTVDSLLGFAEHSFGETVVDETGLTNRYNIRLAWKMSQAELLPKEFDGKVLGAVFEEPATDAWQQFAEPDRSVVAAIKGKLPHEDLARLDPDVQKNIQLMREELAKPEGKRFQPDPEAIRTALNEQLGLKLTPGKRRVTVLVVEPVNELHAKAGSN